jgi:hypothetical protein
LAAIALKACTDEGMVATSEHGLEHIAEWFSEEEAAANGEHNHVSQTSGVGDYRQLQLAGSNGHSSPSTSSQTKSDISGSDPGLPEGAPGTWDSESSAHKNVPKPFEAEYEIADDQPRVGFMATYSNSACARFLQFCQHVAARIVDHPDFELVIIILVLANCTAVSCSHPRDYQSTRNIVIRKLGVGFACWCLMEFA